MGNSSSIVVMGFNDQRHCVRGWYVREHDGRNGVCYRWTRQEAVLRIDLDTTSKTLRMMVSGTSGITGVPASFSVYCAGNLLLHSALHPGSDFWTIVDVPVLPACTGQDAENTEFVLCCETQMPDGKMRPRVFIPDQYLGNGDPREMGIMVAAIRVI